MHLRSVLEQCWTLCARGRESGKGSDILEPIHRCGRKLRSNRLSDARVCQRLQIVVVSSLMLYVLEAFPDDLMQLGLYEAIKATCFRISINNPTFYAILEMYCLPSGTFFTPVGKLGMVLLLKPTKLKVERFWWWTSTSTTLWLLYLCCTFWYFCVILEICEKPWTHTQIPL